jgi:hypothetical protein
MVVVLVRGVDQADFVSQLRGVAGDRLLLIPVDVEKRSAMSLVANQLGEMLVDPCFKDVIRAKGGHVILRDCPDAVRIRKMGPEGLRAFVGNRGVRMTRAKAALIVDTAQRALLLPDTERKARMRVLNGAPWVCWRLFLLVSNPLLDAPFGMVGVFIFGRGTSSR